MKNVFFSVLLLIPYFLSSSVTHIWLSLVVKDTITITHIFSADSTDGVLSVELQRNGYLTVYALNISVISDNCLTCEFDLNEIFVISKNNLVTQI